MSKGVSEGAGFGIGPLAPTDAEREQAKADAEARELRESDPVAWENDTPELTGEPQSIPPVPPTVPGINQDGANGEVAVNTEVLRSFASYLDELVPPLQLVQQKLRETTKPATGSFYQADELRGQIGADDASGLRGNIDRLCAGIIETLTDVSSGVRSMAQGYETTEKINGATAEELREVMPEVAGDIQALTQLLATTAPPATP